MQRFAVRALDEILHSVSDLTVIPTASSNNNKSKDDKTAAAIVAVANKVTNVAAFATVCNHALVKNWLAHQCAPEQQKKFVQGLFQLGLLSTAVFGDPQKVCPGMHSDNVAFDVLAIVGELCRRGSIEDACHSAASVAQQKNSVEEGKKLQKLFVTLVCSVSDPCTVWAWLGVMKMQAVDETTAGMVEDLLKSLPPEPPKVVAEQQKQQHQEASSSDKKSDDDKNKNKKKDHDDDDDEAEKPKQQQEEKQKVTDQAAAASSTNPLAGWSKERKEASKDLLFIDETRQAELTSLPLVCRAFKFVCSSCHKVASSPSAPFSACANCRASFYCSNECQLKHWKESHKLACSSLKKSLEAAAKADAKQIASGAVLKNNSAARDAFCALFFENRAFLYSQRPEAMKSTTFQQFFMEFSAQ